MKKKSSAKAIDDMVRGTLILGNNAYGSGVKVASSYELSTAEIRKAVKILKKNNVWGERGELYLVRYLPSYMKKWPYWLRILVCFIFNHLPSRFVHRIEAKLYSIQEAQEL